jgi:septum formation inhibitor MinC
MEKPDRLVRFADLAKALGKGKPYVTELRQAGRLVLSDDARRCWLQASLARIAETADQSKQGVVDRHAAARSAAQAASATADMADGEEPSQDATQAADEAEIGGFPSYQLSRAKKEHFLAQEIETKVQVARGELLVRGDVLSAAEIATTILRTGFESLPDVLSPQLAASSDEGEVRAILAEAIEYALAETSRKFLALAKQADAE